MDPDAPHAGPGGQLGQRHQVAVVGVDTAGADEADEMEGPSPVGRPLAGRDQRGSREERPVRDGRVDARQVLEDRAPGAEVQVADFRVPHLTDRQTDIALRGAELRVRPAREQPAPSGHRRRRDRVGGRVVPDPEPVEDDQDDRARATGRGDRHAAARRARAVIPARATMPAISSGLSEAPPTRAPSIAGSARNSPIFAEVTLPP